MSTLRDERVAGMKDLDAYGGVARIAGAFADPVRLEIVEVLAQSARSVETLAEVCGLPEKNISYHLQRLHSAGLVNRISVGRHAIYSLSCEEVEGIWVLLRMLSERRGAWTSKPTGEPVIAQLDLVRLVSDRTVSLIDVRPVEEYDSGHLPGALSVPLENLEDGLHELSRGRPVVAYCRGPYCKMATRAVQILQAAGFEAMRFADGVLEWRGAGLDLVEKD